MVMDARTSFHSRPSWCTVGSPRVMLVVMQKKLQHTLAPFSPMRY